jgi:AcrR family transcriptional regulator
VDAQRPRGRPPKYPIEEVRNRLHEAARESLRQHGITSGLDAITLDACIAEAEVPRGSAYRLFHVDGLSPQDAFRREVALTLLRELPARLGLDATQHDYERLYEDAREQLAIADDAERARLARDMIRVSANENFRRLDGNSNWLIYSALRTAAVSRFDDPELREAVLEGEEFFVRRYAGMYKMIADSVGLRIREPYTYQEFAICAYALDEGIAGRISSSFRRYDIFRPTGPNGEDEPWSLFAIAFEALVLQFFEFDVPA